MSTPAQTRALIHKVQSWHQSLPRTQLLISTATRIVQDFQLEGRRGTCMALVSLQT